MLGVTRIPVGVVVERRKSTSLWTDVVWRPVALLSGLPDAEPWTSLATDRDTETFYAGTAEIELFRTETENYLLNLYSRAPSIWVALHPKGGDPPYAIAAVTADPAEGEALTESGQAIVEALSMPESVRGIIASFISKHHVQRTFEKRTRKRADSEALARRGPQRRSDDER
jgi:hypothetical protein